MCTELQYGESVIIGNGIEIKNYSTRKIFIDKEKNSIIPTVRFERSQQAIVINGLKDGDTVQIIEVPEVNYNYSDDETSKLLVLQYKIRDAYSMEYRMIRSKETYMKIRKFWSE